MNRKSENLIDKINSFIRVVASPKKLDEDDSFEDDDNDQKSESRKATKKASKIDNLVKYANQLANEYMVKVAFEFDPAKVEPIHKAPMRVSEFEANKRFHQNKAIEHKNLAENTPSNNDRWQHEKASDYHMDEATKAEKDARTARNAPNPPNIPEPTEYNGYVEYRDDFQRRADRQEIVVKNLEEAISNRKLNIEEYKKNPNANKASLKNEENNLKEDEKTLESHKQRLEDLRFKENKYKDLADSTRPTGKVSNEPKVIIDPDLGAKTIEPKPASELYSDPKTAEEYKHNGDVYRARMKEIDEKASKTDDDFKKLKEYAEEAAKNDKKYEELSNSTKVKTPEEIARDAAQANKEMEERKRLSEVFNDFYSQREYLEALTVDPTKYLEFKSKFETFKKTFFNDDGTPKEDTKNAGFTDNANKYWQDLQSIELKDKINTIIADGARKGLTPKDIRMAIEEYRDSILDNKGLQSKYGIKAEEDFDKIYQTKDINETISRKTYDQAKRAKQNLIKRMRLNIRAYSAGSPLTGFFTNTTVLGLIGSALLGAYLFGAFSVKNLPKPKKSKHDHKKPEETNQDPEAAVTTLQNIINDSNNHAVADIISTIDGLNLSLQTSKEEMDDTGKKNIDNLINNFNQTKTFFEGIKSTTIDLSNKEDHDKLNKLSNDIKSICQKWISILPRLVSEFEKLDHKEDICKDLETYQTLLETIVEAIEAVK